MKEHNPRWPKHGFSALLSLLIAFFLINPLLLNSEIGNVIMQILFSAIMVSIIYLISNKHEPLYFFVPVIIIGLSLSWYNLFDFSFIRQIFAFIVNLIFIVSAVITIARFVLKYKAIDFNLIVGALCIYIMMAIAWGLLFTMLELIMPGSFKGTLLYPEDDSALSQVNSTFTSLIYFSVVTITTLGYGDISPTTIFARSLALLEVLFGVFYLGITISTLIGLRLHQLKYEEQNRNS